MNEARAQKFTLSYRGAPATYEQVLDHWRDDAEFREIFTGLLADSPYTAFRWETPAVTAASIERDFEFVLLQSDALERPVDRTAFASHFTNDDVVTFVNLGHDAVLVVPCPQAADGIYGHLASFLRNAPSAQVHRLWQAVGQAMAARLGERPVWLSTAGMGVSWLHVRLDDRPKYYGYGPYREEG